MTPRSLLRRFSPALAIFAMLGALGASAFLLSARDARAANTETTFDARSSLRFEKVCLSYPRTTANTAFVATTVAPGPGKIVDKVDITGDVGVGGVSWSPVVKRNGTTICSTETVKSLAAGQKPLNTYGGVAQPVNATFTAGAGVLPNATYYYRVTAINGNGESTPSAETSLAIGSGPQGVNVNWTSVPNATGYKIYGRSTGAELLIATVGAVTTYLDAGSITPAGALPTANSSFSQTPEGQNGLLPGLGENVCVLAAAQQKVAKGDILTLDIASISGTFSTGFAGATCLWMQMDY